ncbi:MAG: hypothetical protein U0075_07805 [Thermomicrobiales bacterium]
MKINSFIVTLAMLTIIRGLAYTFTDAAVQNEHKLESFRRSGLDLRFGCP